MPRKRIHILFSPAGEIKFTKKHFFVHIKHVVQFLILLLGIYFIIRYCIKMSNFINTKDHRLRNEYLEEKEGSINYYKLLISPEAKKLPLKGDIYCFVMTTKRYHEDRMIAINNTWIRRCDHGVIYTDSNNIDKNVPFIDLFKNLPKEFNHPFWRTIIALQYSFTKISNKFNWYLKTEDDTFIIIEHLKKLLKKYDYNKGYYMEFYNEDLIKNTKDTGTSYVFSKRAMELFSKKLFKNNTLCPYNNNEREGISVCMRSIGIEKLSLSRDNKGRERFKDWDVEMGIHFKKEGKKIRNLSISKKRDRYEDFGSDILSLHHLTPSEMLTIDLFLYHIKINNNKKNG
uniref:N-acetylgalactosaminide beta-1,3-galactosyltransferase n=1 Tax=Parastrongyloides trichosuri TaxID=131310 RepID=A0A0N4ZQ99_PARTI